MKLSDVLSRRKRSADASVADDSNGNGKSPAGALPEDLALEEPAKSSKKLFFAKVVVLFVGSVAATFLMLEHTGRSSRTVNQSPANPQFARSVAPTGIVQAQSVLAAGQPPAQPAPAAAPPAQSPDLSTSVQWNATDPFKDFYMKHSASMGGKESPGQPAKAAELSKALNISGPAFLPAVQTVTSIAEDKPKAIKIFGITCADGLNCSAITDQGVLKKGDSIGQETVEGITQSFIMTNKRTVEFN